MKKIYILSVLLLLSSIGVFAQDEVINIPDANFKKALLNHDPVIDTNGDGEIQKSETEAFTGGLELNNKLISNLKGIEYFINVTKLNVSGNLFSKIDVSKNIKLTWLNCKECSGITQFDVSNNTALKILEFGGYYCFVKNIDLTNNTELTELNCSSNELTELDLTKNTELTKLSCNSNELTQLDLTNNTELTELSCSGNELIQLDLSKNIRLTELKCDYNKLTQLDLTKNTELTELSCRSNELTQLDLSNNDKLKNVYCSSNCFDLSVLWEIKSMLSGNCNFYYGYHSYVYSVISAKENFEVDYSTQVVINGKNTTFKWYDLNTEIIEDESVIETIADSPGKFIIKKGGAYRCRMSNPEFNGYVETQPILIVATSEETIDIPDLSFKISLIKTKGLNTNKDGAIQLSEAQNYKGKIRASYDVKTLKGIEYFTEITSLSCTGSKLKELDVSKNTELTELYCYENKLTQLNLSKNSKLTKLFCSENNLTQLNLSENTKLTDLYCSENNLTELDISKNTKLTSLVCNYNQLTELDISKNIELTNLSLDGNKLTEIDMSKNIELTNLGLDYNQLTQLDVSKNTKLKGLNFFRNQLTQLDISKNTELISLNCSRNKLSFSELWNMKSNLPNGVMFYYKPQNKIFDKQKLKQNAVIDYSSELTVNGKTTNFVWYNAISNSEVDETSVQKTEEGKFKFLKYGQYYCKMINAEFDDLELQTNTIYILKDQTLTFDVQKTVFVNDKVTLNATVSSGLDITYEIVSGEATLDGNILTPTAEGTLVVKAIQVGNNEYEPVEKEATIQVTKRNQTITFDVKETVKVNDKITLAATASSNLDVTYEVVSGNATLDGSTVTFTEVGKVQIKAKQAGNNEYKAVEKVVTITVTKSTAIDNLSVIGAKIYPNPVTDILNIELPETDSYRVTVFNSTGEIVTQQTVSSVNTAIDMSAYNSGIYIIKVTTDNRSYTGKIVKR